MYSLVKGARGKGECGWETDKREWEKGEITV